MFPIKPCASTALLWALWRAREMASHLNHSWLQFTEKHGQPLLLYSFLYSLCSLRLNSSWFMSAWFQGKLFSLDLCWNLANSNGLLLSLSELGHFCFPHSCSISLFYVVMVLPATNTIFCFSQLKVISLWMLKIMSSALICIVISTHHPEWIKARL